MRWYLDSKHKDHANAHGKMTEEQKRKHLKKFEADLITPAEAALWQRGASNAGHHYFGCAKTNENQSPFLLLDEVQNLADWAPQLKHLVDIGRVRALVTGSSALRSEAGRDSLAGRD